MVFFLLYQGTQMVHAFAFVWSHRADEMIASLWLVDTVKTRNEAGVRLRKVVGETLQSGKEFCARPCLMRQLAMSNEQKAKVFTTLCSMLTRASYRVASSGSLS